MSRLPERASLRRVRPFVDDVLVSTMTEEYARPFRRKKRQIRKQPVTVCISAFCNFNKSPVVLGMTDSMLTVGDIKFEPLQSKVWDFNENVMALPSGDWSDQSNICRATDDKIGRKPWPVKDVAEEYSRQLIAHKKRLQEIEILFPIGLDWKSFLKNQGKLDPSVVATTISRLRAFELDCETIICGIDPATSEGTRPHIYVVSNDGRISCCDSTAFAAVGLGGEHAASQFMVEGYTRNWPFHRALFLMYKAKKRAEIALGVGKITYLTMIDRTGWTLVNDESDVLKELQKIVDAAAKRIYKIMLKSEDSAKDFVNQMVEKSLKENERKASAKAATSHPRPKSLRAGSRRPWREAVLSRPAPSSDGLMPLNVFGRCCVDKLCAGRPHWH